MEQEILEQPEEKRAEIRAQYPDTYFPRPVLQPVFIGRRNLRKVEGTKALVDQTDGNVFSFVSDQYKVVPYEDLVLMVADITQGITQYGKINVVPYTYGSGAKFRLQLKFPEVIKSVGKLDNIVPKIDIMSSIDLTKSLIGRFGAFRQLCTNGMGVWELFRRFARRHLQSLHLMDLQNTIQEGLEGFNSQVIEWKRWAETSVPLALYDGVWQQLPFSPTEREKIEVLPEVSSKRTLKNAIEQKDLTVWDFNNALTQFSTHEIKSDLRKIDLEPTIARVMESTFKLAIA